MMLSAQNKTVIGSGQYRNNFAALSNSVPEAKKWRRHWKTSVSR